MSTQLKISLSQTSNNVGKNNWDASAAAAAANLMTTTMTMIMIE